MPHHQRPVKALYFGSLVFDKIVFIPYTFPRVLKSNVGGEVELSGFFMREFSSSPIGSRPGQMYLTIGLSLQKHLQAAAADDLISGIEIQYNN